MLVKVPVQSTANGAAERGKNEHLAIPKRTGPNLLPCAVNRVLMGGRSQVLLSKGGTGRTWQSRQSRGRGSMIKQLSKSWML